MTVYVRVIPGEPTLIRADRVSQATRSLKPQERRETVAERAARLRCPDCGNWYIGNAQRDAHAAKVGHARRPA